MLGKETLVLPRPLKANPYLNIAWAFPNTYEVGMSSLGYQLVWWLLETDRDTTVYRVFADVQEAGWQQSELIGFTLSWELDYIHVLQMLKRLGVAELSHERTDSEPLIFGGGPVLSANPEPYADFFDAILLGDAEVIVPKFLESWKHIRTISQRQDRLLELAKIEGIYVPSLYRYQLLAAGGPIEKVEPRYSVVPANVSKQIFTPPKDYVAHSVMLSPGATWADMYLVEVARSCPQECRFCLASYLTRPFRAAAVDAIIEKIDLGLRHTRKIGLLGASVTEHPEFDRIAEALLQRPDTQISIASVRADSLNPIILGMLSKLGQRSVTIAMESGSERLRAIMKKNLTEAEILHAVDLIDSSGLEGVKLYGIVGLPGETQDDLDETVRLLQHLKKSHRQLRIVLGLSSFVPKAQTPFQWKGRDRQSKQKLEYLRKRVSKLGIQVRPESHNWSDIQALLSRGDRRLTPLLQEVAQGKGNIGAWHNALRHLPSGCPDKDFYIYRDLPYNETLPWSHLLDVAKEGMLLRHSQSADSLALSGGG